MATLKQPASKILELLESGTLPGRQVGDAWYVTRRQLLAYIEGSDLAPAKASTRLGGEPNILPFGEWRCTRCDAMNDMDRVECKDCRAARMTPFLGFRRKP